MGSNFTSNFCLSTTQQPDYVQKKRKHNYLTNLSSTQKGAFLLCRRPSAPFVRTIAVIALPDAVRHQTDGVGLERVLAEEMRVIASQIAGIGIRPNTSFRVVIQNENSKSKRSDPAIVQLCD